MQIDYVPGCIAAQTETQAMPVSVADQGYAAEIQWNWAFLLNLNFERFDKHYKKSTSITSSIRNGQKIVLLSPE